MKRSVAFLLFFISFGIYLKTLCPTITFGDSGELIAAAYTLGIPHPPGYPLYCLLGKLFTFLPLGSVAYRINLMSAFFASLTVVLIYLIILKIQVNGSTGQRVNGPTGKPANRQTGRPLVSHIPAIVAALCFAFSQSFWSYALVAEVYTLKAFFLALLILTLLRWKESLPSPNSRSEAETPTLPLHARRGELSLGDLESPRDERRTPDSTRYLCLFAFIYGLSFSNHITMALFFPAFLYFLISANWRQSLNLKNAGVVIPLFLLGLLLYLYLPIRSLQNPPIDWGDPENLKNFLWMVAGRQYQYRLFDLPLRQLPQQLKWYLFNFGSEFTWLPILLGIFGLGFLFKKRSLSLFLLLIFLSDSVFNLGQSTIRASAHFFIPSFLIFSLWIGYGMRKISNLFYFQFKGRRVEIYLISALMLFIPLSPYGAHRFQNNKSSYYQAHDWGRNILKLVEKDALVISDLTFPFWYFQFVEGMRPDVLFINPGFLTHSAPWRLRQLRDRYPTLDIAPKSEPIYSQDQVKNEEFCYPIDPEMFAPAEIRERVREGKRPSAEMIKAAMFDYLISHNLKDHPIYFISHGVKVSEKYYLISKGPLYQVMEDRPQIVVEGPQIRHKIGANFSHNIRLLGYNLNTHLIEQGDLLRITYYWKILKKLPKEERKVLVFFTPERGRFVIQEELLELYQNQVFAQGLLEFYQHHLFAYGLEADYKGGEVIAQEYAVIVPSDLPPGTYYINLGVMEVEEKKVWSVLPKEDLFVELGQIEVVRRRKGEGVEKI